MKQFDKLNVYFSNLKVHLNVLKLYDLLYKLFLMQYFIVGRMKIIILLLHSQHEHVR